MPAVQLVQMIDPPPAAIRCGAATTIVFHTPVRLVSSVFLPDLRSHLVPRLHRADTRVGAHDVEPTELRTPSSTAFLSPVASRTSTAVAMIRRFQRLDLLHRLGEIGLGRHRVVTVS